MKPPKLSCTFRTPRILSLLLNPKCRRLRLDLRRIRPDDYKDVLRVIGACLHLKEGVENNLEALVIEGGTVHSDFLTEEIELLCFNLSKCSPKLKVKLLPMFYLFLFC